MQRTGSPYPGSPNPQMRKSRVLVLGAGNFGSCLADHLGDSAHDVLLWSREPALVSHFNAHRRNPFYLKDHAFAKGITAVGPEMPGAEVIRDVDVLLFAIPTEGVRCVAVRARRPPFAHECLERRACRATLTALRPALDEKKLPLLVFVNKGIETSTRALTLEIIADTCGKDIARVATFIVSTLRHSPYAVMLSDSSVGPLVRERECVGVRCLGRRRVWH
jgi:glycerol-3-phosphate dehydrogenase